MNTPDTNSRISCYRVDQPNIVSKINEEVNQMKAKVVECQNYVKGQAAKLDKSLQDFESQKSQKLQSIEEYFDDVIAKISSEKESTKTTFSELCDSKWSQMSVCKEEYKRYLSKIESARLKIDKYNELLGAFILS